MDKPQNYWNEFDWERFFRRKEKFILAYVELLERLAELPEGEELIMNELIRRFGAAEVEEMYAYADDDDEFVNVDEDVMDDTEGEPMEPPMTFPPEDSEDWSGQDEEELNQLFNEGMRRLRRMEEQFRNIMFTLEQTIQGWCNLMSSVLPTDKRTQGLKILFFLSRVSMNLHSCASEMSVTRPAAVIALCKRILVDLNGAIGQITEV
ncbi:MAG TPA: hypothetical protein PKY10_12305, partial [Lentisphaeria bacterium]|nr:hypothetical protein [Lentisphaeria bacterium]